MSVYDRDFMQRSEPLLTCTSGSLCKSGSVHIPVYLPDQALLCLCCSGAVSSAVKEACTATSEFQQTAPTARHMTACLEESFIGQAMPWPDTLMPAKLSLMGVVCRRALHGIRVLMDAKQL